MRKRNSSDKTKLHESMRRFSAWFHSSSAKCSLIIFLGSMLMFALFCIASAPERYDLKVGAISHKTITATKDVEDTITTEERRKAAAAAVEPTYYHKEGASGEVLQNLNAVFAELRTVQNYGQTLIEDGETDRNYTKEELQYAKDLVKSFKLMDYQARTLLRAQTTDFDTMTSVVRQAVTNMLDATIIEGQENQAIQNIRQVVGFKVETSLFQHIVPTVLNLCVKPNMVIETEATELAREKARANVEPVMYLQGQNIIREGERVSRNQLEMLRALGLLEDNDLDLSAYGGAALLTMISAFMLVMMLKLLAPARLSDIRAVSVIMLVLLICEGLSVVFIKLLDVYLAPVALAAMLLTSLLGGRVALATSFSIAIMISGLTAAGDTSYSSEMLHLFITALMGSVVSIRFLRNKPQRVRMIVCGALVALSNLVLMLSTGLMTAADLTSVFTHAAWSMCGALLSGLLAVSLQPLFETVFNLATPSKLLELANPNQPLLRRLLLEAPGTYHHSIIVANLAEAGAEKIGANPLLARTGAYFHDIGKLKRPLYFKENQMGENPHDRTDPYVSAAIVTSHTRDGLQLAQKHRLPVEIQQIIVQHHGDTPVMYFYHKALQQSDGKNVDIVDFRYDGVRPSTKEAAIVMLADTIEAAVRSMPDPTPQAIASFIERLVRGKLEDGQLSDSPLTLRDIDGVCEAFCQVLNGVFHERIEYPNMQPAQAAAASAAQEQKPAQEQKTAQEQKPAQAEPKQEPAAPVQPEPEAAPEEVETAAPEVPAPAEEAEPAAPEAPDSAPQEEAAPEGEARQ